MLFYLIAFIARSSLTDTVWGFNYYVFKEVQFGEVWVSKMH